MTTDANTTPAGTKNINRAMLKPTAKMSLFLSLSTKEIAHNSSRRNPKNNAIKQNACDTLNVLAMFPAELLYVEYTDVFLFPDRSEYDTTVRYPFKS
eukprot:CAMPEP_0114541686 /NCGR_PEP_ID=MMETSP0114-20121206/1435_1 /TAXON_ID=31324 /ORGANISM="Goniomonas sp, Strain m" /LENGTH=96 /DNA_ID=CAMNT_0001725935 /DNA_START=250 /DNA_END=540 /DNA_ORIENTATION=+